MPQHDIQASLAALPIFISACQEMLVLLGETFTSRLWYRVGARDGHGQPPCCPAFLIVYPYTAVHLISFCEDERASPWQVLNGGKPNECGRCLTEIFCYVHMGSHGRQLDPS